VACQAAASPDRGTERLLRELLPLAGALHLGLVDADQASDAERARWPRWLQDAGLAATVSFHGQWQAGFATPPAEVQETTL